MNAEGARASGLEPGADAIVLASASPRRAALLASAGIRVQVIPSHIREEFVAQESTQDHVRRLAETKVRAVAGEHAGRFFIGADTIVVCGGEVMGKPHDRPDAERMLRKLSGRSHDVLTGYAVYDALKDTVQVGAVSTRVWFKALQPEEVAAYVVTGCPLDKAGAYGIQGRAAYMIARIDGSYTNVVGLPLCEVVDALARMGAVSYASLRHI